jgi:hypothetical protein
MFNFEFQVVVDALPLDRPTYLRITLYPALKPDTTVHRPADALALKMQTTGAWLISWIQPLNAQDKALTKEVRALRANRAFKPKDSPRLSGVIKATILDFAERNGLDAEDFVVFVKGVMKLLPLESL